MRARLFKTAVSFMALIMTAGIFMAFMPERENVKAVDYITITFKWSSVDGKKVMDDVELQWPVGWQWRSIITDSEYHDVENSFKSVDGYRYMGMYACPITDYKDYGLNSAGDPDDSIYPTPKGETYRSNQYVFNKDATVYVWMLKEVDEIYVDIRDPRCEEKVAKEVKQIDAYSRIVSQDNRPEITPQKHVKSSHGYWVDLPIDEEFDGYTDDWFEGTFQAGLKYRASTEHLLEFGYCCPEDLSKVKINVNGARADAFFVIGYDDGSISSRLGVKRNIGFDVMITALHDWGKPSYTWSSDNSKVTATAACNKHKDKTLKETVNTTSKVTKQPTTTSTGTKVLTATFSNSHFATQTKTVTIPSLTPTPKPDAAGVGGFVDRLYEQVLGRNADPNGKADWIDRVMTKGKTGADIALGFLFSPEFLNKNMSNGDFLEILYKVFFDRKSDPTGKQYWLDKMANGMSKEKVIWGFINSTEWANVCLRYGIPSGGTGIPNATIEPNEKVIAFATRLYKTCLGRDPEPEGLKNWSLQLANMKVSGTAAAYGFFFSDELTKQGLTNEEFVMRLYRTFMDREADQGGFMYWLGKFGEGATREDVFYGFANSPEFQKICADYGILK